MLLNSEKNGSGDKFNITHNTRETTTTTTTMVVTTDLR